MEYIQINNRKWNVAIFEIKETITKVQSSYSGDTLSGETLTDYIGTKIGHIITIDTENTDRATLDELYEIALTPSNAPCQVTFPHNQATITYLAQLDTKGRDLLLINKEKGYTDWDELTIEFIPTQYQKRATNGY